MSEPARDRARTRLGQWLRRHSLTLVATLGGAVGVAVAAARLAPGAAAPPVTTQAVVQTQTTPAEPAPPPRDTVVDTVQVALLLDTSSSMNGLINQARAQLWKMVDDLGKITRVVDGKTRGVRIELALFEYGNDTVPASAGFIRQVVLFTGDLDLVSEKLDALFTNGGSEFAGQAIERAVTTLEWSSDPAALRFVFVAGNESFDQGPVTAASAMKTAAGKDITVQLIHCGSDDPSWTAAAALAKSDLLLIDQNRVAQHIAAPQDDEIVRLGAQLNDTYLAYGAQGQVAMARQANADQSSAKLSKKAAIERSKVKSKAAYKNDSWDVVDAVANNAGWLANAKDADLPAVLQGKTLEEKKAVVAEQAARRAEIKAQIAKLEAERAAFVKAEQAKHASAEETLLETQMMKSTRKAATKKGYKF